MGLFESDYDKFSRLMETIIKKYGKGDVGTKLYVVSNIASNSPDIWNRWVQNFRAYGGDITSVIDSLLTIAEQHRYDSVGSFFAQTACKLALINTNVPISTRESVYLCGGKLIPNEQRWQLLASLVNDGDGWAEGELSAFYVTSLNLNDGVFPADDLKDGFSLTKKVVQQTIEKYSSSFISRMTNIYLFEYHNLPDVTCGNDVLNYDVLKDIVLLFGFGHLCLKKNCDSQLALQSLNLAKQVKQRVDDLLDPTSNVSVVFPVYLREYHYPSGNEYYNDVLSFCQISDDELAELQYRVGSNYELFTNTLDDYQQVVTHYKSAATSGNPAAMFSLAKVYYSGLGVVPKNEQNAKFWLKKAIDADVVEAIQFQNEHPELKEDGVKNISYHAEGDIIQGNSGIIAKDDAVVNRANIGGDANSSAQEYKFCMYCGAKLPSEARFCMKCGKQV